MPSFDYVLTLIDGSEDAPLIETIAEHVNNVLTYHGVQVSQPDWLAPRKACDLFFSEASVGDAAAQVRKSIAEKFARAKLDVIVQGADDRRKRLIVADLESTLIENEMLDELADFIGLKSKVSEITRRAMNGEIDFVTALKARVELFKDLPATVLFDAAARIRLTPGARVFVATSKAHGAYVALVSGGFGFFARHVHKILGFDAIIANELLVDGGKLTGAVREPILTREGKRATLVRLSTERGIPLHQTLALGDGANDLAMLEVAGLGIAFHAKPTVVERARNHVDHGDLTTLLYAQGYHITEFEKV